MGVGRRRSGRAAGASRSDRTSPGRGAATAVTAAVAVVLATAVAVAVVCTASARPARAASAEGPWTWPLAGPPPVTRGFAPPEVRYGRGHRGVDLAASPGAPVRAAGAGRVSYAGLLAGRGVVVVQHGPLRTTYEPVTAAVAVGQHVARDALLGRLEPGHPDCAAAACLHWGLRRGEQYLDPLSLVGAGPVRLLPVLDPGGRAPLPPSVDGALPVVGPVPGAHTPSPAVDVRRRAPVPEEPSLVLRAAGRPSGVLAALALLAVAWLSRGRLSGPGRAPRAAARASPAPRRTRR